MTVLTNEELGSAVTALFLELQKRGVTLTGETPPTDNPGVNAPVGAQYIQTFGGIQVKRYQKYGLGPTEWGEVLSAGGGSGVAPIVLTGDSDVEARWHGRDVVAPLALTVTLLNTANFDAPNGFYFNLFRDTASVVQVTAQAGAGGQPLKSITGVNTIAFVSAYSWMSICKINGFWCAEGRVVGVA